ncbi:MAG: hypothetical protein RL328_1720 [Acidobacteriota bacterium]
MKLRYGIALLLCAPLLHADSVVAGSVAVLPFTNLSANPVPGTEWIGESIAEALRETLAARGLPVMDRGDVLSAYADLRLRPNAELTRASVLKMGQSMNADQVIYGAYRVDAATGMLSVSAAISDRARALLLDLIEENGLLPDLDRVEAHLGWQALMAVAPAVAPPEDAFVSVRPPVRINAEEAFIKALVAPAADKERYLQQAVRADDRFARPMLELGKIELARKNNRAAADWFTKIAVTDPHFAEAMFYLGVAKFRDRDYVAAQAAFEKIQELLPAAEVFNNLGVAESRRGLAHALSSFREALDLNPNHPDYHFNMGYILFKTGQYEAAAERFRAVLDREPGDAMATSLLGRALKGEALRKGNPADTRYEALERFKESFERPYFRVPRSGAAVEP